MVSGLKNSSMLVFKIDVEGGIVWSKTYAGKGHTEPYDMIESGDGGFVILAYTEAFGITDHGLYIVSIDAEGNTTWERTYPDVPTAWGITGNRIAWSGPDYIVLWGCEALEADR